MLDSFHLQGIINLSTSENKLCIDLMTERVSQVPSYAGTTIRLNSPIDYSLACGSYKSGI